MPHITGEFTGMGTAPGVVSAEMIGNIVYVTFSEEMSLTGLTTNGNYSIPGVTVQKVEVVPNSGNTRVGITVTGYNANTQYTVTVSNVTDKAGNTVA